MKEKSLKPNPRRPLLDSVRTEGTLQTSMKTSLRIAAWNVLTMNNTGYQVTLVNEMTKYNISIASLAEA